MYIKTMENRKKLVKQIEQLTETKAEYTRMPECAFVIGEFKVERYGTLVWTEEADPEVVSTLLAEGMIREYDPEEPESGTEQESDEETQEPREENAEETEPTAVAISLPMAGHTASSLRNLLAMIKARGDLISKATGGHFHCSGELMIAVSSVTDTAALLSILGSHSGMLEGMEITPDRITFTGFPETADPDHVQTFMAFASLMNKLALEQKHTRATAAPVENEKYIFRIWLLRLGMAGEEYRTARRILLAPLSGSVAFRDEGMRERWKANRAAEKNTEMKGNDHAE